jgi:hypothetical protein
MPPVLLQLRADGKRHGSLACSIWMPSIPPRHAISHGQAISMAMAGSITSSVSQAARARFTFIFPSLAKADELVGLAGMYNGGRKPAEKKKGVSE